MRAKLIAVLPKNYRHIALHAVGVATQPVVMMDQKMVVDLCERGPFTQEGIRRCINFEVRDWKISILGFHDHPKEAINSSSLARRTFGRTSAGLPVASTPCTAKTYFVAGRCNPHGSLRPVRDREVPFIR